MNVIRNYAIWLSIEYIVKIARVKGLTKVRTAPHVGGKKEERIKVKKFLKQFLSEYLPPKKVTIL